MYSAHTSVLTSFNFSMSESSDSNAISSSEESESTQSQGNHSQSSAQESQGSDVDEKSAKTSSPETSEPVNWGKLVLCISSSDSEVPNIDNHYIISSFSVLLVSKIDLEAKYPYRFHPERDELMKACVAMKEYTMKPPIVKPWNPAKGRRDRFQGNRGESHSRGKRRRDF